MGILPAALSCSGWLGGDSLPPEGQVVLGVTTDAWLPPGAGEATAADGRIPLFERLRIELFAPGETAACAGCTRDFGIDHRTVFEGRASVGFVPRPGVSGYRVRVRLYHSGASESAAEPRDSSSIMTVVALPPVGADGITDVHVTLRTDDVSRPRGTLDAPVAAEEGPAPAGLAGTWHQEIARGCAAPARAGEACVPGGAYWMGDPGYAVPYERLVAVSPFYIDRHEVTVAEVRASGLAFINHMTVKADPYPHAPTTAAANYYCTYTSEAPGDYEAFPVNCVTPGLAAKLCAMRGGALPTEAQYEFVAGARRDAAFPWGDANPACGDAVFGRAYAEANQPVEYRMCSALGTGAAKPGSGALDRVRMPDGNEVVDLAANLTEWSRDTWQVDDEPCRLVNPAIDPLCVMPSKEAPGLLSVRGGSWEEPGGAFDRAAVRESANASALQNPRVGFRCARSGD